MALDVEAGRIGLGRERIFSGVSGQPFTGVALRHVEGGLVVAVGGRAFHSGESRFVLEPDDPLPGGFALPARFSDLRMKVATTTLGALLLVSGALPASAADLDGAALGPLWAVPFAGLLLSIALVPLVSHHLWERIYLPVALGWAALALGAMAVLFGGDIAGGVLAHAILADYLPFVLLLLALYVVSGGIVVRGSLVGGPALNTGLLALGALLASVVGTTGASVIMVRPLIRANAHRRHRVHLVVFFIFLVSNIGGALTPLGDPPLFLGFLRGVSFFWTTRALLAPTAFCVGVLLLLFYLLERTVFHEPAPQETGAPVGIGGLPNVVLIGIIIGAMLGGAAFDLGTVQVAGVTVSGANLFRDGVMAAVTLASLLLTRRTDRIANGFTWGPMREVASLFAGIFITIAPVIAMLGAGARGAFAPLVALVSHPDGGANERAYFWLTGLLSAFLDNAPTYLVFFGVASAGAPEAQAARLLMTEGAGALAAISMGAVFMGALTYVGNAPNLMVGAIARDAGVAMPGFFGYMLWSGAVLLPLFGLVSWLFVG